MCQYGVISGLLKVFRDRERAALQRSGACCTTGIGSVLHCSAQPTWCRVLSQEYSAIHKVKEILRLSGWIVRHIFRNSVFLISWPTSFQFLVIPIANKDVHNFKERIFIFERVCCISKILFQRHFLASARRFASRILGFTGFVISLLRDVVIFPYMLL